MPKITTHLCPPGSGGVSDFIDILTSQQENTKKLKINKNTAKDIKLSGSIFLHFSGYGYSKRGAPWWLLQKLKAERKNIDKLGVFFHEIYAFGYPWSSAFWLSPAQRYITSQIAQLSDFWITNREGSARWLRRFAAGKPHDVLPVFSNIGELESYTSQRAQKVIVFGGTALRMATYRVAGDIFFDWIKKLDLELHDIGPPIADKKIKNYLIQAGAIQHGLLEKEMASRVMQDASFGLVNYPHDFLTKSGVFAAYCSHGICPIVIGNPQPSQDGLQPDIHFLTEYRSIKPQESHQEIGRFAFDWYQQHCLFRQIEITNRLAQTK